MRSLLSFKVPMGEGAGADAGLSLSRADARR